MYLRSLLSAGLLALSLQAAASSRVQLPSGIGFTFDVQEGILLGLGKVDAGDQSFRSGHSLLFPFLASEFGERAWVAPFMRWEKVERLPDGFTVHLTVLASTARADFQTVFVMKGDKAEEIYRDSYGFAHCRLPAELTPEVRSRQAKAFLPRSRPIGRLMWTFRDRTSTVSGWKWQGWSQQIEFTLEDPYRVNAVRVLGSWEATGGLKDLTLVNLRYRGLGRIEQLLDVDPEGASTLSFTTTEILPGAARKKYAVSPALPGEADLASRAEGLRHRLGAWIAQMGRGAGVNFIDYQFHPRVLFAGYPLRQGDLRALTEVFPGDQVVSQTDVEMFPLRSRHVGIPMQYRWLAAPESGEWTRDEARNRWMELNLTLRDQVSEELKFVQQEVMPTIGLLWEFRYGEEVDRLARELPELQAAGVRQILLHNPGWVNGGSLRRKEDGADVPHQGGGNCNIYDWTPLPGIVEKWRNLKKGLTEHDVRVYIWLSGMSKEEGAFAQRIGLEESHWALNRPDGPKNATYGEDMRKHNPGSDVFLKEFQRTLEQAWQDTGFRGFWGDSSQNLMFSQLNWGDGSGGPLQRIWWEEIARWTRKGVGWQAESTGFPGQSCSIEVKGWEQDLWYFHQVNKWLRGDGQSRYQPEKRTDLLFRAMAVKGWIAPDLITKHWNKERQPTRVGPDIIPEFSRLAHEYLEVLPRMKRPLYLPDEQGLLWLEAEGMKRGVLFPMKEIAFPESVTAARVSPEDAEHVSGYVWKVEGEHLPESFGIRMPPIP